MTGERYVKLQADINKLRETEDQREFAKKLSGLKQDLDGDLFSLIGKYKEERTGSAKAEARPVASQRAAQRLLARFDLERLAEFVTLNELRVDLESVLLDILQAATEDEQSAQQLQLLVEQIRDLDQSNQGNELTSIYPKPEIEADLEALALVEKQARALKERANLDSSSEPLLQLLLPIQEDVSSNWATLSKRLRRPVLLAIVAAIVGISLYFFVGMNVPSVVSLGVPILSTVISFVFALTWQRRRIENDLLQRKQLIIGLDPVPRRLARDKRFWEVSDPDRVLADITREVRERAHIREKSWIERKLGETAALVLSVLAFSLLPSLVMVGLLMFAKDLPLWLAPKYDVVISGGQGVCILETGMVVWPGPIDVVLLSDTDHTPVVIRRSEVISMNQSRSASPGTSPSLPRCTQVALHAKDQGPPAIIRNTTGIVALFKPNPIHNPPWRADEIRLTDASLKQIKFLRSWIADCTPKMSVLGFASPKEFPNLQNSRQWNYQLAEVRRDVVVKELKLDGILPSQGFDGPNKMEAARPFKSLDPDTKNPTEQMARLALINIENSGTCSY
jgi:hypothetical protein